MTLEIVIWDVQHGNGIFIKTPNGTYAVKDLGSGSYSSGKGDFSPLLHIKEKYGIERLDYVIISHPHKDHISDIMNFDDLSPRVLCRPKHLTKDDVMRDVLDKDKPLFEKYFEINQKYSEPISPEENPKLPRNNGGVEILNFHPKSCEKSNINNHSIVTILSYAESKVILPGDNESPSWKELLKNEDFINAIRNADILLAPHHGRKSGYYQELFDYFKPYITVVSDGRFCDSSATNRYGNVSKGWTVHHRISGEKEKRYCLTTRKDGVIVIKLGYTEEKKTYIAVTVD
ncbi:MAG: ComEC/Rec2 family competence protein [Candidatus Aminicenantaceae bacterium]